MIQPLDFVRTPNGNIALVTEMNNHPEQPNKNGGPQYSITFIGEQTIPDGKWSEKNAWWDESELVAVDNLASLLARELLHPFGTGEFSASAFYPKPDETKARVPKSKRLK